MRKSLIVSGVAMAAALVLTGCSGNDAGMSGMDHNNSSAAPSSGQQAGQNADDVAFAQQMIEHHSQALDMSELVPSRSTNPQVIDLASRIEKAQDPEIQQMKAWLTAWGAGPAASSSMPMDHGSMSGMMTEAEMKELEQAKGADFDKMWLGMMIRHHQGAVDMAKTELAKGSNADAKALAQKIIDAQDAEIREMQGLLPQG
ncbi:DUF305 domain-containing protein [Amycolatopsis keratiniphila]|uniref:DUF305 domain-containing protein n=1 Tax=Amycolatopsis keratiniphila TaxID=129921 RepID=UPI00087DD5FA|nr:DUF305 domain-containing protein [Amycolatopsis keratiniphila]OLZ50177.1 DUF305 domain-containing protein [Amycolatopsis keratiniphila subsp. nogabecina]SDU66643.1 Uncharacterized conserved protein, DUF305 family [Amycolatopsis keratiniphila]